MTSALDAVADRGHCEDCARPRLCSALGCRKLHAQKREQETLDLTEDMLADRPQTTTPPGPQEDEPRMDNFTFNPPQDGTQATPIQTDPVRNRLDQVAPRPSTAPVTALPVCGGFIIMRGKEPMAVATTADQVSRVMAAILGSTAPA